jgi:hypothetical protein
MNATIEFGMDDEDMTHFQAWKAIDLLLTRANKLAALIGSEQLASRRGDTSVEEYGGHEWGDFETQLATLYVHLGGDLTELSHALTQPWAQTLQDKLNRTEPSLKDEMLLLLTNYDAGGCSVPEAFARPKVKAIAEMLQRRGLLKDS